LKNCAFNLEKEWKDKEVLAKFAKKYRKVPLSFGKKEVSSNWAKVKRIKSNGRKI
jgi:hypothetical protein